MAVRIRLKRTGTTNAPAYRVVVTDGRSPRDGRFIEEVGTYLPLRKGVNFNVKLDRIKYWVDRGAQPSDTVASLVRKAARLVQPA
jgi:small subunit ribosomal protein S16